MVNTRTGASADAIQRHYDVGNDFYRLWLGPEMIYSSALWHGDEDLDQAQQNKINWHLNQVIRDDVNSLLDVGCGWGSLMRKAKNDYNVREVVGITLSKEQSDHLNAMQDISAKLESWMDHKPSNKYDAIVSIGALEHFARLDQSLDEKIEGYRAFFEFCHNNLNDHKCLSIQTIVYENSDRKDFSEFFSKEIFPESDLPHLSEIIESSKGLFEIVRLRNDRSHYADTLRSWLSKLRASKEEAVNLVGIDNYLRYEKYLSLMVIAFHTGSMNLCRVSFRKKRLGG